MGRGKFLEQVVRCYSFHAGTDVENDAVPEGREPEVTEVFKAHVVAAFETGPSLAGEKECLQAPGGHAVADKAACEGGAFLGVGSRGEHGPGELPYDRLRHGDLPYQAAEGADLLLRQDGVEIRSTGAGGAEGYGEEILFGRLVEGGTVRIALDRDDKDAKKLRFDIEPR